MIKVIAIAFFFIFTFACQPIEKIDKVVFDNKQFASFDILSNSIEVTEIFEQKISEPYIGHTLKPNPSERIINWVKNNFKAIGRENNLNIIILDATITQNQFENKESKKFDEKNNYKYEIFYLLEFNLYDDSNNLLVSTIVETSRSTTSGVYISIQEKEKIIDELILQAVIDISNESKKLLTNYMGNYLL